MNALVVQQQQPWYYTRVSPTTPESHEINKKNPKYVEMCTAFPQTIKTYVNNTSIAPNQASHKLPCAHALNYG